MSVHPDKTALRAVDACGGTFPKARNDYDAGYERGYDAALDSAKEAVRSADALTAEMLEALTDLLSEAFRTDIDLPTLEAAQTVVAKAAAAGQ